MAACCLDLIRDDAVHRNIQIYASWSPMRAVTETVEKSAGKGAEQNGESEIVSQNVFSRLSRFRS